MTRHSDSMSYLEAVIADPHGAESNNCLRRLLDLALRHADVLFVDLVVDADAPRDALEAAKDLRASTKVGKSTSHCVLPTTSNVNLHFALCPTQQTQKVGRSVGAGSTNGYLGPRIQGASFGGDCMTRTFASLRIILVNALSQLRNAPANRSLMRLVSAG